MKKQPDSIYHQHVKVALRIRPFNNMERARGDQIFIKSINNKTVQTSHKAQKKNYQFTQSLPPNCSQENVFDQCMIQEYLDSALVGYSSTIFAYGQTGSGKTYTMMGAEQKLIKQDYVSDESEGIIPRAIKLLWKKMGSTQHNFYVKSSFVQIYNQQIHDLLNLNSGNLHIRWNQKSGFFVEDLIVVDSTNIDDLLAVLHQGIRNRKSASHQLNKDSSRSHSIMTIYIINQSEVQGQILKKYGKISFVDLAGSQRLKQSKSHGQMVKQTGNINKSLFTLGKVIKCLSQKSIPEHIPYRDSKLTQLLMDSLGGSSKCLMIACVSPSLAYFQETSSTLSYASRTMNIKNKPVIQMQEKQQTIFELKSQIELLRKENSRLRQKYQMQIFITEFLKVKNYKYQTNQDKTQRQKKICLLFQRRQFHKQAIIIQNILLSHLEQEMINRQIILLEIIKIKLLSISKLMQNQEIPDRKLNHIIQGQCRSIMFYKGSCKTWNRFLLKNSRRSLSRELRVL